MVQNDFPVDNLIKKLYDVYIYIQNIYNDYYSLKHILSQLSQVNIFVTYYS
jgi:hypothetical protein